MNSKLSDYGTIITRVLFFIFFYLYLLLNINPAISYFIQQPVFLIDREFLGEHLSYPGGLIEYISQFLAQFYYYPWAGALILTLVTWCISYITLKIARSLKFNRHLLVLQIIPAIGLLFIHSRYDYILTTTMILLSSVVFYYLHLRLNGQKLILRLSAIIISSVILFYISGGGALLHFLLLCLVSELSYLRKYDFRVIALLIILGGVIPYLSVRLLFYITLKQAYFYLLYSEPYYHPPFILYVIFAYFPIIILYARVNGHKLFEGLSILSRMKTPDEKYNSNLSFLIQFILIIILTALTVRFAAKPEKALVHEVKYLAYNEQWDKLLRLVREHPSDDRFVNFHTNRALYHTGKFSDEMFDYPQTWGKHALFMGEIVIRTVLMDNSDVYFDLGHIRAAQHWAYEAQTIYENSPRVLKRLALTNIILDKYKPAGSILGILRKSIVNKDWAEYYQQCIDNPPKLEKDSLIRNKRNMPPRTIFFMDRINVNYELLMLLDENEKNKMAFEYLMAYYLLSNEIGNMVKNLSYLEKLGYKQIPRTYEEALMVYLSGVGIKRVNIGSYNISESTIERYRDYARIVHDHNNDSQDARDELYKVHGNTYWYYLHFTSPVTAKRELKFKVRE